MSDDWCGWHLAIAERPADPVDMGIAFDIGHDGFAAVLWCIDADGVAYIEDLMGSADYD